MAAVSGVFGLVLVGLGATGSPEKVFGSSHEWSYPRARTIHLGSWIIWQDAPPEFTDLGEPYWWATFGNSLANKDFQDTWWPNDPPQFIARGDPRLGECETNKFEQDGYVFCFGAGMLNVLATKEVRQYVAAQTANCEEYRCFWVRGRMQPTGEVTGSYITKNADELWEIRQGRRVCAEIALQGKGYIQAEMDGKTYKVTTGTGKAYGIDKYNVVNTGLLPMTVVEEFARVGQLENGFGFCYQ